MLHSAGVSQSKRGYFVFYLYNYFSLYCFFLSYHFVVVYLTKGSILMCIIEIRNFVNIIDERICGTFGRFTDSLKHCAFDASFTS